MADIPDPVTTEWVPIWNPTSVGPVGPQGPQGIQGEQGIQGDTGPIGPQGVQGVKGDEGDQGVQGTQGVQGVKGDTGAKGDKGDTGNTGATGPQGIQGIQGETGPEGPKGDTGDNTQPHHVQHEPGGNDQIVKLELTGPYPHLRLTAATGVAGINFSEMSAPVDGKKWALYAYGQSLRVEAITDAETTGPTVMMIDRAGKSTWVGNVLINKTRPELILQTGGDVAKGRVFQAVPGGRVDISANFYYTGSAWSQDDTANGGALLVLDATRIDAYTVSTTGVLTKRLALADTGKHQIGGQELKIYSSTYADLGFYAGGYAAGTRYCKLQHASGNLNLYMLDDGDTAIQSIPMTWYRNGNVNIGGALSLSGALVLPTNVNASLKFGAQTDTYPALRDGNPYGYPGYLEVVTAGTPAAAYAPLRASFVWTTGTSNSLGDLTCRGATDFQNGIYVSASSIVVVRGAGNSITSGWDLYSTAPIYPGREDTGWTTQSQWYLSSHASYGLKSNTGLYLAGGLWVAGGITFPVSVWHNSSEGHQRLFFESSSVTYLKGHGIAFRNLNDTYIGGFDVSGNFTASGTIGTSTNVWRSNFHPGGLIYPGQGGEAYQTTWYIQGHGSYGIYCNTGLYVQGNVWSAAGFSSGVYHVDSYYNAYIGRWVGTPDNGNFPGTSGNGSTNSGFLKFYVGGSPVYVPYYV